MQREELLVGGAILGLAAVAWLLILWNTGPMMGIPSFPLDPGTLGLFAATWTTGMIAMMFPTAVPALLMFLNSGKNSSAEVREGGGPSPLNGLVFVSSYIGIWVITGLLLYVTLAAVFSSLPVADATFIGSSLGIGVALLFVAVYQLSPIKGECLRRCHPTSFFLRHYRGGITGAVEMGLNYAKFCVGCCWVMMIFLLVSASMGVVWMGVFASIIFLERSLTTSPWSARIVGLGFLLSGAFFIIVG